MPSPNLKKWLLKNISVKISYILYDECVLYIFWGKLICWCWKKMVIMIIVMFYLCLFTCWCMSGRDNTFTGCCTTNTFGRLDRNNWLGKVNIISGYKDIKISSIIFMLYITIPALYILSQKTLQSQQPHSINVCNHIICTSMHLIPPSSFAHIQLHLFEYSFF